MFFNKKTFYEIGEWDENIFLYFEELLFCTNGSKKKLYSYQINEILVETKGTTVVILNKKEKNKWLDLLIWHFIWSKYYFHKKKYGKFISLIIFLPILARILFRITLYKITKNKILLDKYSSRLDGLLKSMKGKKSSLRP